MNAALPRPRLTVRELVRRIRVQIRIRRGASRLVATVAQTTGDKP